MNWHSPTPQALNQFKNIFADIYRSVFIWFIISYGVMYLFNAYMMKQIFYKFHQIQIENIALQSLENRNREISFFSQHIDYVREHNIDEYISDINQVNNNIHSIILKSGQDSITLEGGEKLDHIPLPKIEACLAKEATCPAGIIRASELGLNPKFEDYFVYPARVLAGFESELILHTANIKRTELRHRVSIASTQRFLQFLVLSSFIFYILIGYGLLRPVMLFIEKIKIRELVSDNFLYAEPYELNHVRFIRSTLYRALKNKEKEEEERLSMQNLLLSQQKEAEVGKIVSQISHDLRSPLVVFESLLKNNSPENFTQQYESAKRALLKMQTMINALRQADKEALITKSIQPLLLSDLHEEIKLYAENNGIKCKFDTTVDAQKFILDHAKIERCMKNLLRNAIEHAHSRVGLHVSLKNTTLVIEVNDDGPGVRDDVLTKLFTWRSTGNPGEGTGIGLSYAKQIAMSHGGDLEYSRCDNTTHFTLTLPGALYVEPTQPTPQALTAAHVSTVSEKREDANSICFFIKKPEKMALMQQFFQEKPIKSIFVTHDLKIEYLEKSLVLYIDSSDPMIEEAIAHGIHVILAKESDKPQDLFDKIVHRYPTLVMRSR